MVLILDSEETITMGPPTSKVALVTGANGISGFSVIEHLVRQSKEEWFVSIPIRGLYLFTGSHGSLGPRLSSLPDAPCPMPGSTPE